MLILSEESDVADDSLTAAKWQLCITFACEYRLSIVRYQILPDTIKYHRYSIPDTGIILSLKISILHNLHLNVRCPIWLSTQSTSTSTNTRSASMSTSTSTQVTSTSTVAITPDQVQPKFWSMDSGTVLSTGTKIG